MTRKIADKKRKDRPVVGNITFPVRPLMLDGDKSGFMMFRFADTEATIQDDDGKRIGTVGGAMGGNLYLSIGGNSFSVRVPDLWDGFVDFLRAHPEVAVNVDMESLTKFSEQEKK